MFELLSEHSTIVALVALYVFQAAATALPEDNFQFYPWFLHTVRLLTNAIPQKYQLKQ